MSEQLQEKKGLMSRMLKHLEKREGETEAQRHLRVHGIEKKAIRDTHKEEVQQGASMQLDELSKKTLGSYVKKASNDMYKAGHRTGYLRGTQDKLPTDVKDINKLNKRSDKRATGISRAVSKLEEAEQQGAIMNEDFAPISDLITLVANEQHAEATPIIHDLLGARVLDAMQGFKQEIAQSLFAPSELAEEAEELEEAKKKEYEKSGKKTGFVSKSGKFSFKKFSHHKSRPDKSGDQE